jgi:hypothetical protein
VFSAAEAYLIENGKVTHPVKGATLIGNGPDVLTRVSMIGNDLALDSGIGTCGKEGQSVPVGVGQPTLKIEDSRLAERPEELAARIPDGAFVALPPRLFDAADGAGRELIRRKARNLKLLGCARARHVRRPPDRRRVRRRGGIERRVAGRSPASRRASPRRWRRARSGCATRPVPRCTPRCRPARKACRSCLCAGYSAPIW